MSAGLRVRPAIREEAEAVLALWAEVAEPSSTDDLAAIETLLGRDPGALLVAEEDGRIVGTLVAAFDGWRGAMYRLAVAEDARRGGVGTRLVREGERRLGELGARRILALVLEDSRAARAFWAAAGYAFDERMRRFVKDL